MFAGVEQLVSSEAVSVAAVVVLIGWENELY